MVENLPIRISRNEAVASQASTDQQLIELWLHGRSNHTQRAYRADIARLLDFLAKPLIQITLQDLHDFSDELKGAELKTTTVNRTIAAVKSLFSFAHRLGYLPFDVAKPLRIQTSRDPLPERLLSKPEVRRMIESEKNPRNHILLLLLYTAGLRVSELRTLKWRHLQERDHGGQVTAYGKRGKTRTILLSPGIWDLLKTLQRSDRDNSPVFCSRRGGHLSAPQIWRIVHNAAKRAGIDKNVSPHCLRFGSLRSPSLRQGK